MILVQCISSFEGAWCSFHFQSHQKFPSIGCLTMQLPKFNHLKFSLPYDATSSWLQGQMINLGMKIGYDSPGHVNDVITTSCIAIYGVKEKKDPRIHIKILKPYFPKLFNYVQPTQGKV